MHYHINQIAPASALRPVTGDQDSAIFDGRPRRRIR
jgi:hypothetical protein